MEPKKTVTAVLKEGDYRASLVALRDKLAEDIDNPGTLPGIRAQLVKQAQSVLADIQAIPDPEKNKGTVLDDLLNGDDA